LSDIVALLRQLIQAELARQLPSHIGVVEAVRAHSGPGDTENYGCDVRLRGRDVVLTGVPIATDHLGTVATPAEGDVVLVHFAGGDPGQPVIGGRLYSDALRPPPYDQGEITTLLPPDAGESDRVEIAIKGGKNGSRSWTLKLPSDVTIAVTDKKLEATVGKLSLVIDGDGGEATIKTSGSSITAKDGGDVTIEGNGNLTVSAQGNLEIKAGGNLKLNASGTAELKGAVVNIN
jgi:uncharacterized protein involved in type VI secretion and phage assembly